MKTLLAFEFKKLLGRRVLWIALALCAAMQILNCYGDIRLALGGATGGMKEVYARYDGQAVTETLKARMLLDYREYAAAHPGEFKPSTMDIGYWALDEQVWSRGHGYGVMLAYQELLTKQTMEEVEDAWRKARDELASGVDSNGNPLGAGILRLDTQLTTQLPQTPVVRYDLGWSMGSDPQGLMDSMIQRMGGSTFGYTSLGVLLVLLLVLTGLPGFAGERSARMEAVLLTGARRKPAALAKLLAVTSTIAATALTLCLLNLLLREMTLGLGGWYLPSAPYGLGTSYLAAWAATALGLTLGCAAGAVVITAVSAIARDGITALGLAAGVLAAQYGAWMLAHSIFLNGPGNGWTAVLNDMMSALPLNVISSQGMPYGILPTGAETSLLFALPLVLCAACLLIAPGYYLRLRKV